MINTASSAGPGSALLGLLLQAGPLSPLFLIALLPLCGWASLRFPRSRTPESLLAAPAFSGSAPWRPFLLPLLTGLIVMALCSIPVLSLPFSFVLGWMGLSGGALLRRVTLALDALEYAQVAENPAKARQALQPLFSFSLSGLELPDLYRLLAQAAVEGFLLNFVYPLFWFALAGAPGMWCAIALRHAAAAAPGLGLLYEGALFPAARLCALMLKASYNHQYDPGGAPGGHWPGLGIIAAQTRTLEHSSAAWPLAAASWLHHGRSLPSAESTIWLGPDELPDEDGNLPHWEAERLRALLEHLPRAAYFTMFSLAALPLLLLVIT